MLDTRLTTPLYVQLADLIRARIDAGDYTAGEKIASEHELAGQFSVGRPTVRQATEQLVKEGLLERRRGSGTFVADASRTVDLLSLGGTIASFRESGLALETHLTQPLRLKRIRGDGTNPFTRRDAFTATRLGTVDGEPVVLEEFFFSPTLFPSMDVLYKDEPFSQFISRQYRVRPLGGQQAFSVVEVSTGLRKALKPDSTHLLEVRRTLDFPGEAAAVFVIIHCNTQNHTFTQQLGN